MSRRIKIPRLRRRGGKQDQSAPESSPAQPTPAAPEGPAAPAEAPAPDQSATSDTSETSSIPAQTAPDGGWPDVGPLDLSDQPSRRSRLAALKAPALIGLAVLVAAGAGLGAGYLLFDEPADAVRLPAVAPTLDFGEGLEPAAAEQLGFPAFATRNTTRVGGSDSTAVAAGVALASYPAVGGVIGPPAAVLAPSSSWQAALAAASLSADPIGAPILLGTPEEVPAFTTEALTALKPTGLKRADDVQLVAIGDVAKPEGLKSIDVPGSDPADLAQEIDRQRAELSGQKDPDNIIVTSAKDAGIAMPAAAWAARSGDPIAFADGDAVPDPTIEILKRHPKANVYVLGGEAVISEKARKELEKTSGRAIRIGADDPVTNAIEFARFSDGAFGWNINDPGHGFAIANDDRPADAGAGAPLAAGGKPGPLLVTDSAEQLPLDLRNFLLDTKPGFTDDPARAVYNHVWLLGDENAISVGLQVQIDALTELERVTRGSGVPNFGSDPGAPEAEADTKKP